MPTYIPTPEDRRRSAIAKREREDAARATSVFNDAQATVPQNPSPVSAIVLGVTMVTMLGWIGINLAPAAFADLFNRASTAELEDLRAQAPSTNRTTMALRP